jgi:protein involved in polysaccharide export with SLBB domain
VSGRYPLERRTALEDVRAALERAGGLTDSDGMAARWKVSRRRVNQIAQLPGFPEPLPVEGDPQTRVWFTDEVDTWRAEMVSRRRA